LEVVPVTLPACEANRPNRLGNGTVANRNPNNWFNADFPVVPDLSFYKNFTIREKSHLQFRFEVFNELSHDDFQLPINNVAASNAGTLTSVVSPGRQIQFGAGYAF
jgi:hypothetical protein